MIIDEDLDALKKFYNGRDHNNPDYANTGNLGFGWLHYAFIRNLRPQNILVVGSQRGYIPAICGMAVRDEGEGHVHFVDAGFDETKGDKKAWGGIGIWKKATPKYWTPILCEGNITIHCMTTEDYAKEIDEDFKFGYIYIDGDHSFEGVTKDFQLFWPHLEQGGIMAFHDVDVEKKTKSGRCGVKRFWDEYFNQFGELDMQRITISGEAGLGIIQKG